MSLPAAPPPELINKAKRVINRALGEYVSLTTLEAALNEIWPDLMALAAAQHDQEQQLRQTIADEIRALSVSDRIQRQEERFDEPCDAEHWECHAAAAGMAFAMAAARAQRGQELS